MLIGNRNFPYPILNRDESLSDYEAGSRFFLKFDTDETTHTPILQHGSVIFKNLCFVLKDKGLEQLVEDGKLEGAFIVECSSSAFRKKYRIDTIPYDLSVSSTELNGNVVVARRFCPCLAQDICQNLLPCFAA